MDDIFRIVCLSAALLLLPLCYLVLCGRMRSSGASRPPYFGCFALFGSVGGWLLAVGLSPSGLAAMCVVFQVTIAPLALLASACWLSSQPERSPYDKFAIYGSFCYVAILGITMAAAALSSGL